MFNELDVVKSKISDKYINVGQVGTIVDVIKDKVGNNVYTIDFYDEKGNCIEDAFFNYYFDEDLELVEPYK